jgi:hypothetical protein
MTDDLTITAEGFTLHYQEKISTGEYENATVSATIEGSIDGAEIDEELPLDVRSRLLRASKSLQKDVEQAAQNRVVLEGAEDWWPEDE